MAMLVFIVGPSADRSGRVWRGAADRGGGCGDASRRWRQMTCLQHGAATCWVAPEAAVALVTPAKAVRARTTDDD